MSGTSGMSDRYLLYPMSIPCKISARRRTLLREDYLRYKVLEIAESREAIHRAHVATMEARCMLFTSQSDEDIVNNFARGTHFYEFRVATMVLGCNCTFVDLGWTSIGPSST